MNINRYLINFLESQNKHGYDKFIELCEDILDRKKIKGLNKYPRDILAIELEKMIMMCVEQNRIKYHYPSYFKQLKLKEPMIYSDTSTLKNYIKLFVKDRDSIKLHKYAKLFNIEVELRKYLEVLL